MGAKTEKEPNQHMRSNEKTVIEETCNNQSKGKCTLIKTEQNSSSIFSVLSECAIILALSKHIGIKTCLQQLYIFSWCSWPLNSTSTSNSKLMQ